MTTEVAEMVLGLLRDSIQAVNKGIHFDVAPDPDNTKKHVVTVRTRGGFLKLRTPDEAAAFKAGYTAATLAHSPTEERKTA